MRFKFKNIVYEVPEGFDIEVDEFDTGHGTYMDYNIVRPGEWGEHLPMLGGVDENGDPLPTWEELGIRVVSE